MASAPFLAIPSKATLEVDLEHALRTYAAESYATTNDPSTHPDTVGRDARKLQELRTEATPFVLQHGQPRALKSTGPSLNKILLYHAQLVYMLTKLPSNLELGFPWYPMFSTPSAAASAAENDILLPGNLPSQGAIGYPDVEYERCNILLNAASEYTRQAGLEDRSKPEGIKRAIAGFQFAAGVLLFIRDTVAPCLSISPDDPQPPSPDLSAASLTALANVALAQAQECVFQKALQDHLKNGSISKIAYGVSALYETALTNMIAAKGAEGVWPTWAFTNEWVNRISYKRWHFAAVAQYRKSCDDLAANRYGDELGRLHLARKYVNAGLEVSKKGVPQQIIVDIKSLQATLADLLKRAERDNTLIYLQAVTAESALPSIQSPPMVRAMVPQEVEFPLPRLHSSSDGLGMRPLFEGMVPYAVQMSVALYDDRKDAFIRDELQKRRDELDAEATKNLQALNLPGALQALEVPLGLPPSLLRNAEELRRAGGTKRLRTMVQDALSVAATDRRVLEDVSGMLQAEEDEDKQYREHFGAARWDRPASSELNSQLKDKIARFKDTLDQANQSDIQVRAKFQQWEGPLKLLEGSQDALEASIPKTADSGNVLGDDSVSTAQTTVVRELRRKLENLDDLKAARQRLLMEARQEAKNDDVRELILRRADDLQSRSSDKLDPSQFESLYEKELEKYSFYRDTLAGNERKQSALLAEIRIANDRFLESRRNNDVTKQREEALQRLDTAFAKHAEISVNLSEALQFYQEFAKLLDQLRGTVREWVNARRAEAQAIQVQLSMENTSLRSDTPQSDAPQSALDTDSTGANPPPLQPPNQPGTPRQLRAHRPGKWEPGQPIRFG